MSILHDLAGAGLGAALWFAIGRTPLDAATHRILRVGFVLCTVGCLARLWVSAHVFGGGDYLSYVHHGEVYAAEVLRDGLVALFAPERWAPGRWWGAGVVDRVTGVAVLVVGPSVVSTGLVFTYLSFVGLVLFALAFHRALPGARSAHYAAWLVLAPSMVFWPSLVGKEALLLLGLGMMVWGVVGEGAVRRMPIAAAGLAVVFAVRPPVAVVFVAAYLAARGVRLLIAWSPRRALETAVAVGLGLGVVFLAGRAIATADLALTGTHFSFFDPADVVLFLQQKAAASQQGGSAIARPQGQVFVLGGLVDVLFRPFLWRVTSAAQAGAALEVAVFWTLVVVRRKEIGGFIRQTWREPLLLLAFAFTAIYVVALGLALDNEGTLVRQRVLVLPFLLALVAGRLKLPRGSGAVRSGSLAASSDQGTVNPCVGGP